MGVTTKKKMIPITIGEITTPKSKPNLNQSLFNGVKIFELIIPKNKKITEIISDQFFRLPLFKSGYIAMIKKTKKNTIPKLLFELIKYINTLSK